MKKSLLLFLTLLFSSALFAQVKLDSGLVACYPFNGNANDMTGNGHNAIVTGATLTADRFGNPNSAYMFTNSPGCYLSIPNFGSVITTNDISISFWSQANSNTSDQPFLLYPDSEKNRLGIAVNYTSVGAIWDYGSLVSPNGRMVYSSGYSTAWQHYVFLVSQSMNIKKIYLDGVMVDSSSYGMACNIGTRSLNIGGAVPWSGGWLGFPGVIDDIRIYNRALTDAEVKALYNVTSSGLSCSPLGVADIEGDSPYIYSPSAGVVYMDFGHTMFKGTLAIYNMLGQRIDEKAMNVAANGTDIYTLRQNVKGIYVLVLTSEKGNTTAFKFIR